MKTCCAKAEATKEAKTKNDFMLILSGKRYDGVYACYELLFMPYANMQVN